MRYKYYFVIFLLLSVLLFSFDKTPNYFVHDNLLFNWETKDEFEIPESVCYDGSRNKLYVSNVNGDPTKHDGNGFISMLTLDGDIQQLKWVTGLDAPKGMGVFDEKLFVTDINKLRIIDLSTGSVENSIEVEDARFLNDITISPNGDVYISDMLTQRIYRYKNGQLELWLRSESLQQVNGLYAGKDYLYAGLNDEIVRIDYSTKRILGFLDKTGGVDGLENIEGDYFLFSDWQGRVYAGQTEAGITKLLDSRVVNKNAADIEFITERRMLFVPTFSGNTVTCYTLSGIP
jgi:DNA-binding beta-propeller fold protein YncE